MLNSFSAKKKRKWIVNILKNHDKYQLSIIFITSAGKDISSSFGPVFLAWHV